jgi:hypothetical protein
MALNPAHRRSGAPGPPGTGLERGSRRIAASALIGVGVLFAAFITWVAFSASGTDERHKIGLCVASVVVGCLMALAGVLIGMDRPGRGARTSLRRVGVRRCVGCGCTDMDCSGCVERTGEACFWVDVDLCSACLFDGRRL